MYSRVQITWSDQSFRSASLTGSDVAMGNASAVPVLWITTASVTASLAIVNGRQPGAGLATLVEPDFGRNTP